MGYFEFDTFEFLKMLVWRFFKMDGRKIDICRHMSTYVDTCRSGVPKMKFPKFVQDYFWILLECPGHLKT